MDTLEEAVNEASVFYDNLLETYTKEYNEYPDGKLLHTKRGNKINYFLLEKDAPKRKKKGITTNIELIRKLARKEYLRRAIGIVSRNVSALHRLKKQYGNVVPDDIVAAMPAAYQTLPKAYFFRAEAEAVLASEDEKIKASCEAHRAWAEEAYERSNYKEEHLTILTTAGFYVRSKTEAMIVEKLVQYGVPFRYEMLMYANGYDISPDFTFEAKDGSLFYWEHGGLMDNDKYRDHHYWKIGLYESLGINRWTNLIETLAGNDNKMNVPMIEAIIEREVIPRL